MVLHVSDCCVLLWWSEAELFCVSAVFTNETEAELERDVYRVSALQLLSLGESLYSFFLFWTVQSELLVVFDREDSSHLCC